MINEQFLQDNRFSSTASVDQNVYMKDVTTNLPSAGNLHAHVKVTFDDEQRSKFEIHGTIRVNADAEALGKRQGDENTVGRALWIYDNGTCHTPVEASFWKDQGGLTSCDLKHYARELRKQVVEWKNEIERQGGEGRSSPKYGSRPIDKLGTSYAMGR